MICENCRKEISDYSLFCENCGYSLEGSITTYKNQSEKNHQEQVKKRNIINLKSIIILTSSICFCIIVTTFLLYNPIKYYLADKNFCNENYEYALEIFESLKSYKDSEEKSKEARYNYGLQLYKSKNYEGAINQFKMILNYKDAKEVSEKIRKELIEKYITDKSFVKVQNILNDSVNPKEDTDLYYYINGVIHEESGNDKKALENYALVASDYRDVSERIDTICMPYYKKALEYETASYTKAIKEYERLPIEYKDVKQRLTKLKKFEELLGEYECYEHNFEFDVWGSIDNMEIENTFVVDIYESADGIRIILPNFNSSKPLIGYISVYNGGFNIKIPKEDDMTKYIVSYNNNLLLIRQINEYQRHGTLADLFLEGLTEWVSGEFTASWRKISVNDSLSSNDNSLVYNEIENSSLGEENNTVIIPNLIGLTEDKAKEKISKSNLILGAVIKKESSESVGIIIEQSLPSGTRVAKNTAISLSVSKGI